MKSEYEIYRDTGILGGYIPERVVARRDENAVTPIFRDTSYWHTDKGLELHREMIVGERRFLIRSILSNAKKAKTPTEQMLHVTPAQHRRRYASTTVTSAWWMNCLRAWPRLWLSRYPLRSHKQKREAVPKHSLPPQKQILTYWGRFTNCPYETPENEPASRFCD